MTFDVRLPIGFLFLTIGAVVALCGLFSDPRMLHAESSDVNIDLAWGLVMAVFGAVMITLAAFARRAVPPSDED